ALAIVNGKSLLQRNIEYLQQYNIKDVVVNVHHFADQVINVVEKNKGWGSNVIISDEREEVLETGGGLLKAREYLEGDTFITINVDILTELNLKYFLSYHQQQGALITLATAGRDTKRFLLFNKYNRLCGWRNTDSGKEKIVLHHKELFQKAYSGIALFEPRILGMIPFTGKFSLIDVYLALAPENKIVAFDHTGDKFIDVGKPDSVTTAEQMFA
ncbi:MAG: nucleotidyltransferase family protein, partial [Flavisolibacter sp.]|nr:nucleotidyltransferase family protein [Flavisolibacter sp.]